MSEDYTKNDDGELRDYTMYKIIPKDESLQYCYIGHTTNFTSRKNQHKTPCININSNKSKILKINIFINYCTRN